MRFDLFLSTLENNSLYIESCFVPRPIVVLKGGFLQCNKNAQSN